MMSSLHLSTLPIEIQCLVFRLLDPIGLISISQASSYFRALINPQKIHFVERLLTIECRPLEQNGGGISPMLHSIHNNISFHSFWRRPKWNTMKLGCSSCLRLLPFTSFNSYYAFEFCYRKPISGSPAADQPTSWENIPRGHKAQEEDLKRTKEGQRMGEIYRSAVMFYHSWRRVSHTLDQMRERFYHLQKMGLVSFMEMTLMDFMELDQSQEDTMLDKDLCVITLEHCGFKRCSRKCKECHVPLAH